MNPENKNSSNADNEEESTAYFGFNWQRYKNDRRELHEKLTQEQQESTSPTEPDTAD